LDCAAAVNRFVGAQCKPPAAPNAAGGSSGVMMSLGVACLIGVET
jgi:hypothetical protein